MEIKEIEITKLKKYERNVRVHGEDQIKELQRSLEKFGQTRPLIIDENNTILVGNGLYEAMKKANYKKAKCIQKTNYSEQDKKRLIIADNKTYELGVTSYGALNDMFEELAEEEHFDIPGICEGDLEEMFAKSDEVDDVATGYGAVEDNHVAEASDEEVKERSNNRKSDKIVNDDEQQYVELDSSKINFDKESKQYYTVCNECGTKIWL